MGIVRSPSRRSVLASLLGPTAAALALSLGSCSNLHTVEEGRFYRSAQLDGPGFTEQIQAHGLRTVVRLRGGGPGDPGFDAEAAAATAGNAKLVQLPMSARRYPTRAELLALWDTFEHGEYPMLVHCKAGADRTSLASALYVLQRTGDLKAARAQLALTFGHTGWGTNRLDRVLEMYGRWHGRMDFRTWVQMLYWPPGTRL